MRSLYIPAVIPNRGSTVSVELFGQWSGAVRFRRGGAFVGLSVSRCLSRSFAAVGRWGLGVGGLGCPFPP